MSTGEAGAVAGSGSSSDDETTGVGSRCDFHQVPGGLRTLGLAARRCSSEGKDEGPAVGSSSSDDDEEEDEDDEDEDEDEEELEPGCAGAGDG